MKKRLTKKRFGRVEHLLDNLPAIGDTITFKRDGERLVGINGRVHLMDWECRANAIGEVLTYAVISNTGRKIQRIDIDTLWNSSHTRMVLIEKTIPILPAIKNLSYRDINRDTVSRYQIS